MRALWLSLMLLNWGNLGIGENVKSLQNTNAKTDVRIQNSMHEFDIRYKAYKAYIANPKFAILAYSMDYFNSEPLRRLIELGPVEIPWLIEKMDDPNLMFAVETLLRTSWPEQAGIPNEQIAHVRTYEVFHAWWGVAPAAALESGGARMHEFRNWLGRQTRAKDYEEIRTERTWQDLQKMGILGMPSILRRIRIGEADQYDYRLMAYWTDAFQWKENIPEHPRERAVLPSELNDAGYWLRWWKENGWQYWWIPNID